MTNLAYSKLYKRKTIIIKKILEKRENYARKIQNYYYFYVRKKILFAKAKKLQKYYSIYPSKKYFNRIMIKLFTDGRDPRNFQTCPVKFCTIRNCYIFDIPKSKFVSREKILLFNFIIDNKIEVDDNYDKVLLGSSYVNKIDFRKQDREEYKYINLNQSASFTDRTLLARRAESAKRNYKNTIHFNKIKSLTININSNIANYQKFSRNATKTTKNDVSDSSLSLGPIFYTIDEEHITSKKSKTTKPILKENKSRGKISGQTSTSKPNKRVSFGNIQTKY